MTTYGEKFVAEIETAINSLERLIHIDYEEYQIRDYISSIGIKIEIFLKAVTFPNKNPRDNFHSFINELSSYGIEQNAIDKLHAFRRLYNNAKHAPNATITLLHSIEISKNTLEAIRQIVRNNIGMSGRQSSPNINRVYWIAAWDHYIGGDTEVHIILPGESKHWLGPPTFDIIYIRMEAWDTVKSELSNVGALKDGKNLIPKNLYDSFSAEGDFLAALVFEGDYRNLITVLAQYEKRQELLSGLNRHDSRQSMMLAYLLAAADVIGTVSNIDELKVAMIDRAHEVYAVPNDYNYSELIADNFVKLFCQLDYKDWQDITGPVWVSEEQYSKRSNNSKAKHNKYPIIIDSDNILVMLWKT